MGRTGGLERLYRDHAPAVLAFLHGLNGGDPALSRAQLLETFTRAAVALPRSEPDPLPWLLGIARDVTRGNEKAAGCRDGGSALRAALSGLAAEERALFVLCHDQKRTPGEAALALGWTLEAVQERLRRLAAALGAEALRRGVAS